MKRTMISKFAMGSAAAALALGAVACDDMEAGDDLDPGMEDDGMGDDGMDDDL